MSNENKQNNDRQDGSSSNENSLSSLIEQIVEQLTRLRQDDLELTDQLTFLYDRLCHLRQTLTGSRRDSTTDIPTVALQIDSSLSNCFYAKPRADSEPNILSDRQSFKAVIEDFQ